MEGKSRFSYKYLLLQVWCGILTVAMVVMAALLISIKPKSTEAEVPTPKPSNVNRTDPTVNTLVAPLKSPGSSLSYIQLIMTPQTRIWQEDQLAVCRSCSLVLLNNSIHCTEGSVYFIYAHVTFNRHPRKSQTRSVILRRNPTLGKAVRKLAEGTFPDTTAGTVWLAKIVSLAKGDSVSLDITDDPQADGSSTFWGAYQLG